MQRVAGGIKADTMLITSATIVNADLIINNARNCCSFSAFLEYISLVLEDGTTRGKVRTAEQGVKEKVSRKGDLSSIFLTL